MPDQALDLAQIAADLEKAFPHLTPLGPLSLLGTGFRNIAVETTSGLVFRIARNRRGSEGHARERAVLPLLGEHTPLAVRIPDPLWYAPPGEPFQYGVIGYTRLPGTPLDPERLRSIDLRQVASETASFLLALHSFPLDGARLIGIPKSPGSDTSALARMKELVLPTLCDALSHDDYASILLGWDELLADASLEQYPPVLQHGDFWYDHMLVDNSSRLVGIIDFESVAIGDPAQDFATLLHLGEDFADAVISAYAKLGGHLGSSFENRLQKLWQLREFDGLQAAIEASDGPEIADALRKLRRGPILK